MDAFDKPLPEWVQPGTSFRIVYGQNNRNNEKLHIRGIVDGCAVVCWWRRRVHDWEYKVLRPWDIHLREEHIKDIKKENIRL